ncbi:LOW QUALITY PROTEIN: Gag protein [Phytophthora palmivora]|uniref:Gag protein n=1 Tax=Phytophthora palmivora TaxID=4796 RepID=A0A2P4X2F3_9STRA|nr:LOW QUALITY PROTEIN: Gag protein [Phytophthora palmivora]
MSKSSWGSVGAHHRWLVPESLNALETRTSSGGLLVVHESSMMGRRRTLLDARRSHGKATSYRRFAESEGRGQVSVRLADGTVCTWDRMDLAVKFEDFDSTDSLLVLDMDKHDLILGMPWLANHEPWINWRGKAIGASRPRSPTELWWVCSHLCPGLGRQRGSPKNVYTSEEVMGVADTNEGVAMILSTGHEAQNHCQACGFAATASPNAESRRAAGNIGPQAAEAAEESADGVSCVGNIGPQAAEAAEEDAESASDFHARSKKIESAICVSSVGNRVPRGVKKTSTSAEVSVNRATAEEQCHVFDGVSGRQVKPDTVHLEALPEVPALLKLEELSMKTSWPS